MNTPLVAVLLGVCGSVAFCSHECLGNQLEVERLSGELRLSWAAAATGYNLESTDLLAATNWITVTNAATIVGDRKVVTLPVATSTRFFRLRAAAPAAPVLTNLSASSTITFATPGVLSLDYADPDGDVVSLFVVQSNIFGIVSNTVPASFLRLTATAGHFLATLRQEQLAFGTNVFTIWLRDRFGLQSVSSQITTVLTGAATGGTAPTINSFAPVVPQWNRPAGARDTLRPPFVLNFADPEGDIERVRVRVRKPDGSSAIVEQFAQAFGIAGISGSVTSPMITVRQTELLGTHTLEVTLIDRAGHLSSTVTNSFTLVASGGAAPLSISSFSPTSGGTGTVVTVFGRGFDTNSLFANRVSVATVEAEVLEVRTNLLSFIVPSIPGSGRIRIQTQTSVAISEPLFLAPASVSISPESPEVVVGKPVQFSATVISGGSNPVTWSVNGFGGGDAQTGTITSNGVYTAPVNIPTGGVVTVRAASGTAANAQTIVKIVPPPSTPGAATVLASAGGLVQSLDGRATVTLPPGALTTNAHISVSILRGAAQPPAASGRRVLGAVDFGPSGTTFLQPVTVTIPLVRAYPAGTQLPLRFYNPGTQQYVNEGILATVTPQGDQATALINHFSIAVVDDASPASPPTTAPLISDLKTITGNAVLLEGTTVPVLITGAQLTDDLTVEIHPVGSGSTNDVTPGTLFVKLTTAALTLSVNTLRGFNSGTRDYQLRLVRPNGLHSFATFSVQGLPELDVAANTVTTMRGTNTFSEANIHGILQVLSPDATSGTFRLNATGPVNVTGKVDGKGSDGGSANGQSGGSAGPQGGRGGQGRSDDGCGVGIGFIEIDIPSDDDCAGEENHGGNAMVFGMARDLGSRGPELLGYGGRNGFNNDLTENIRKAIQDGVSCIASLGADTLSCVAFVADVYELADDVLGLADDAPTGRKGLRAAPFAEHGGGGGGGAGRLDIAGLGPFSANIIGGGGGAGGEGGHDVAIVSPSRIDVTGVVTSAGGNGGNGAATSELNLSIPFFDIGTGVSLNTGFSGGGGGAGSGGDLKIASGTGVFLPTTRAGHIIGGGGKGGAGGIIVSEVNGQHFQFTFRSSHADTGFGRAPDVAGPRFDPALLQTSVSEHAYFPVRGMVSAGTFRPRRVEVRGEQPGQTRSFAPVVGADGIEQTTLLLFPGFNTVTISTETLLNKTILVLAQDSDGDDLTNADEAQLGTDPARADTDGDGVNDGAEILAGTNPNSPDSDGDGLPDPAEGPAGTSPNNPDTDGDGFFDSAEVFLGSNPTNAPSLPADITDGTLFADSSALAGPAFLTLLNPNGNTVGLLGQPNSGLKFDIAFDANRILYFSRLTSLSQYAPLARISTAISNFHTLDGTAVLLTELAYNSADDSLYGQERGPGPDFLQTGQLLKINPANALVTRVGVPGESIKVMTFNAAGQLFAALTSTNDSDRLVELDPVSGAILREIGLIGFTPITGLAFDATGTLWAAQFLSNNESRLLELDQSTGLGFEHSRVPRAVFSMAFLPTRQNLPVVSINAAQTATGNSASAGQIISGDGRFVAFGSDATNLVTLPDGNNASDAFVRDLQSARTELASVDAAGNASARVDSDLAGGFGSSPLALNYDGRYVVFNSPATNLTAGGAQGFGLEIYRRDRVTGTTVAVSGGLGVSGNSPGTAVISADGQTIVFTSRLQGIFVWKAGLGAAVSLVPSGRNFLGLTPDAHYLFFTSNDPALSPFGSTIPGLYRKDLISGAIALINVNASGTGAEQVATGFLPSVTADGHFVAFQSGAANLTSMPDTNGAVDVFVRDMQAGQTTLVSVGLNGTAAGTGLASASGIAANGRFVVFISAATNLVAGLIDTNNSTDAFMRDLQTGVTTAVSVDDAGRLLKATEASISADGQRIAFVSGFAYLRDTATSRTFKLDNGARRIQLSNDGTAITYDSTFQDITRLPDNNGGPDVFVRRVPR